MSTAQPDPLLSPIGLSAAVGDCPRQQLHCAPLTSAGDPTAWLCLAGPGSSLSSRSESRVVILKSSQARQCILDKAEHLDLLRTLELSRTVRPGLKTCPCGELPPCGWHPQRPPFPVVQTMDTCSQGSRSGIGDPCLLTVSSTGSSWATELCPGQPKAWSGQGGPSQNSGALPWSFLGSLILTLPCIKRKRGLLPSAAPPGPQVEGRSHICRTGPVSEPQAKPLLCLCLCIPRPLPHAVLCFVLLPFLSPLLAGRTGNGLITHQQTLPWVQSRDWGRVCRGLQNRGVHCLLFTVTIGDCEHRDFSRQLHGIYYTLITHLY